MSKIVSQNQTGVLMFGPGGMRLSALQAKLVPLTTEQHEMVSRAKKYATEQSIKHIMTKKVPSEQQQQQKTLQRHQALVLMCRVYVGSISFEVNEAMIQTAFSPYGTIKSVNMSWDPITLKHKGFAFVEYELPEAAQLALEKMNGFQLGGRQIKVGRPSNMPQAAPVIQEIQEECKQNNRIYVTNVHPGLNEQELAELFEPFGNIRMCKLSMTPNVEPPQHRGCGFIEFMAEDAANESLTMNNFEFGGSTLYVCRATTPAESVTNFGTLETTSANTGQANQAGEEDIQAQLERANREQGGDISDGQAQQANGHVDPSVSNVIVLKNMVTANEELDDALQLDVYQECSKYGPVTQVVIYVDKKIKKRKGDLQLKEAEGNGQPTDADEPIFVDEIKIFVKYKDGQSSLRALEVLNGRFFGGRKVSAQHYDREAFRRHIYTLQEDED